mgnify:CR=1 FL=1
MDLRPRQLIAAVIVISAATSFLVVLLTFGLLSGEQPREVVERIIEQSSGPLEERILRQDELVVSVVKRAASSVVSIVATRDVPVVEQFFINPFGGDPFLEQLQIPQFRQRGTKRQEVGAGTGFIVSADGLILTNRHVVADTGAEYTVFLNDGTKLAAKVLARDPVQDLAVMKIDPPGGGGLPVLSLGDSAGVEIGQSVIAIGNALGEFRNTVSVGVISGLQRTVVASSPGTGSESLAELMQTDAAINPGNSGGPLLDLRGEVIAINTAIAQGAENIGFAIPINKAKRDIESVKSFGRIVYPFIGIRYHIITKDIQARQNLPVDYGALVAGDANEPAVVPGSPAEKAGLKANDIILEFNGEKIEASNTLAAIVGKYKVGDRVTLKVRRGADTIELSVVLEERK